MKRRKFIRNAVVGGLTASLGSSVPGLGMTQPTEPINGIATAPEASAAGQSRASFLLSGDPNRRMTKIGRWTLEELRDYFQKDLFENRLPLWLKYGIDRRFGGFLTDWRKDGTVDSGEKRIESQGRLLWLFSYVVNNLDQKKAYFDAARQGKEALLRHGRIERGRWRALLTRDWKAKDTSPDPFAGIGVVLGLTEYARAGRDREALNLAGETASSIAEDVLAPHFQPAGPPPSPEPGTKSLAIWIGLLEAMTPLVESSKRADIEAIARMCARFILQYHWQRNRGWALEYLRQDFTPFPNDALGFAGRAVSGRQGVAAARALMAEALRSGNRPIFLEAMELGFRSLETCWEGGPEFGLVDFEDIDTQKRAGDGGKPAAALYDVLAFTLEAIEHTHSPDAVRWFTEVYGRVWNRPGLWNPADGFMEPRGAVLCLEALNHLIARKGHLSPFFF